MLPPALPAAAVLPPTAPPVADAGCVTTSEAKGGARAGGVPETAGATEANDADEAGRAAEGDWVGR